MSPIRCKTGHLGILSVEPPMQISETSSRCCLTAAGDRESYDSTPSRVCDPEMELIRNRGGRQPRKHMDPVNQTNDC